MRRFLPVLIVILAGLLFLPGVAAAQGGRSSADRALATEERKREWGELLLLGLVAGGIGFMVVMQGAREFLACLPKGRKPVNLDDYDD